MGTFIVVNDEGWALTAGHVVQNVFNAEQHKKDRLAYQAAVDAINSNPAYSTGKKKHEVGQLPRKWDWITHTSMFWAVNNVRFATIHIDPQADLAIAKLEGDIKALNTTGYPVFGKSDSAKPLPQGTSLCRLGFPFYEVKALFDPATESFSLPELPPLAMFPNDGILTRHVRIDDAPTNRQLHFIETSSAGLLGQSGGPIFDANGNVWAVQSRTTHLPLGFAPKVKVNGKEITEHQFMHVGWGVEVSHIRELLEKYKVKFQSA